MKFIYDNINNYTSKDYEIFLNIIKKEKYDKIKKLININSKKRSILGEILLIKLLKDLKINYDDIDIYINENGKPYIKEKNIFFNISHSNDFVICVVSKNEIGVDIEKIRNINYNVIKHFATNTEIKYIEHNKNFIFKRAFEIFTLKEAYFKCYGSNLNNIKEVHFNINDNFIFCSDKYVDCKLIYDIDNYIIAICENNNI